MRSSLVVAAALATLLTVTACSAAEPQLESAPAAPLGQPQEPARSTGPAEASDAGGGADAADAGDTDASALRTGSMEATLRSWEGEPGLLAGSGASIDDVLRLGAIATWVDAPDVLAISLPATADCWAAASAPDAVSSTRISIEFSLGQECGAFDAARTYTVRVPAGVDAARPLEVVVEGLEHRFTLTLPAER